MRIEIQGDRQNMSLQSQEVSVFDFSVAEDEDSRSVSTSSYCGDKEAGMVACRVCHCNESDKRGDAALAFLGITPPSNDAQDTPGEESVGKSVLKDVGPGSYNSGGLRRSGFVEFISPNGEVFVCKNDVEMVQDNNDDKLLELGCACKNALALVHYACALKWFILNGSTICEICGCIAENVKFADVRKVMNSLKDYEALRERTVNGEPTPAQVLDDSGVDPDAVAAIRRQRLSEISLWFKPHDNSVTVISEEVSRQTSSRSVAEEPTENENSTTRLSLMGSAILVAAGLLTVILSGLIAPRVGKRSAKTVTYILLAGVCALAVMITFRFFVLTRHKYGRARYWIILFVFWFIDFGVWAARIHRTHAS